MSFMFELYYPSPEDQVREARITAQVIAANGRLDFREAPDRPGDPIVLTFELEDRDQAERIATVLRGQGEHIVNICEYG